MTIRMQWLAIILLLCALTCSVRTQCQSCDLNNCTSPENECLSGLVKDECNCCYTCGRREGERCFSDAFKDQLGPDYPHYVRCGDNLECRMRTDLSEGDRPEAICYCLDTEPVCASNGITYENECQFTEARYKLRNGLFKLDNGPCKSAPKIISPPEDTTNNTGSSVALTCEAQGSPRPNISWKVLRENTEIDVNLNQSRIEVESRQCGNYSTISWLQMVETIREDSGTYICVASNSEGDQRASAYITIGNFHKQFPLKEEY